MNWFLQLAKNMNDKRQNSVQSIHRAIAILRAVSKYDEKGVRLSKVAQEVNLHVATTRRLLQALALEGFIKYDAVTKLYHIGYGAYGLVNTDNIMIYRDSYHSALEAISNKTGDTTYLVTRSGYDLICIDQIQGNHMVQVVYDIGMRAPLGCGGGGAAILAASPDNQVKSILAANESRYIEHNNISLKKIKNAIKLSRKLGFGLSEGLFMKGVTSVGLPISSIKNEIIGAICVASVPSRMDRRRCQNIAKIIKSEIDSINPLPKD